MVCLCTGNVHILRNAKLVVVTDHNKLPWFFLCWILSFHSNRSWIRDSTFFLMNLFKVNCTKIQTTEFANSFLSDIFLDRWVRKTIRNFTLILRESPLVLTDLSCLIVMNSQVRSTLSSFPHFKPSLVWTTGIGGSRNRSFTTVM